MNSSGSPIRNTQDNKRKRDEDDDSIGSPRTVTKSTTIAATQNVIVQTVPRLSGKFFKINNKLATASAINDIVRAYNQLIANSGDKMCLEDGATSFHVLNKRMDHFLAEHERHHQSGFNNNIFILKLLKLLMSDIIEIRFAGCTTRTQSLGQVDLMRYLKNSATRILTELHALVERYNSEYEAFTDIFPNVRDFIKQLNNIEAGKVITDDVIASDSRSGSRSPVEEGEAVQPLLQDTSLQTIPVLAGAVEEYNAVMEQLNIADTRARFLKDQAKAGVQQLQERIDIYAVTMQYMKSLPVFARIKNTSDLEVGAEEVKVSAEQLQRMLKRMKLLISKNNLMQSMN